MTDDGKYAAAGYLLRAKTGQKWKQLALVCPNARNPTNS